MEKCLLFFVLFFVLKFPFKTITWGEERARIFTFLNLVSTKQSPKTNSNVPLVSSQCRGQLSASSRAFTNVSNTVDFIARFQDFNFSRYAKYLFDGLHQGKSLCEGFCYAVSSVIFSKMKTLFILSVIASNKVSSIFAPVLWSSVFVL